MLQRNWIYYYNIIFNYLLVLDEQVMWLPHYII